MLSIGTAVLLKDFRARVNRGFFMLAISVIAWGSLLFGGYAFIPNNPEMALLLFRFTYAAGALAILSLTVFFYFFPRDTFPLSKKILIAWFITGLVIAGLAAFTPLVEQSIYMEGNVPMDVFGPLYAVYLFYLSGNIALAAWLAFNKIRKNKGVERKKILIVSCGLFTFALLAMLTNAILPLFDIYILQKEAVAFSLIFFAAVFYAIFRQRFFNFSFLTLHAFRSGIIFLSFISLVVGLRIAWENLAPGTNYLVQSIVIVSFSFFAYKLLERGFPRLYSSSFRHFRNTVGECGIKVFNCKTYKQLLDLLNETFVEKLSIPHVKLHTLESLQPDEFSAYLEKNGKSITRYEISTSGRKNSEDKIVSEKMKLLGAEICFPLISQENLIGFFILGVKQFNKTYSLEEIHEIEKIISSLEIVLMNILLTNTLHEENDIMKKIIRDRTFILKENNERLEKMVEQQDHFLSMAAHEFRTPLTVAMLSLDQISYAYKGEIPAHIEKDIRTSHKQLGKLADLVNRLLDARKAENDNVSVVPRDLDIVQFMKETAKSMQLLAKNEGMKLKYESTQQGALVVETDPVRLREIIENLLQNAMKFSHKDGEIVLKMDYLHDKKKIVIRVMDKGKGIARKDLNRIFEKFQQGRLHRGGVGAQESIACGGKAGIGIGLYLCKKYVELLGGTIAVTSSRSKGSAFTVELPVRGGGSGSK